MGNFNRVRWFDSAAKRQAVNGIMISATVSSREHWCSGRLAHKTATSWDNPQVETTVPHVNLTSNAPKEPTTPIADNIVVDFQ